jgi:hypothetical protein
MYKREQNPAYREHNWLTHSPEAIARFGKKEECMQFSVVDHGWYGCGLTNREDHQGLRTVH